MIIKNRLMLQLLLIEFRAFVRNKRFILLIVNAFFFPIMCLHLIFETATQHFFTILFVSSIMSNGPALFIGIFVFNKDGCFFDGLRTRPLIFKSYVTAKILFLMLFSGLYILVTVPFILYMQPFMQLLISGCLVYMIGASTTLMVYYSSYDKKKLNYRRSPLLNYEGMLSFGKNTIPLLPVLLLLIFYKYQYVYVLVMFLIGAVGLLFVKFWIHIISKNLARRKYLMMASFRQ